MPPHLPWRRRIARTGLPAAAAVIVSALALVALQGSVDAGSGWHESHHNGLECGEVLTGHPFATAAATAAVDERLARLGALAPGAGTLSLYWLVRPQTDRSPEQTRWLDWRSTARSIFEFASRRREMTEPKKDAPNSGKVIEVKGVVIDVAFTDHMPAIYNALEIEIAPTERGRRVSDAHRRGAATPGRRSGASRRDGVDRRACARCGCARHRQLDHGSSGAGDAGPALERARAGDRRARGERRPRWSAGRFTAIRLPSEISRRRWRSSRPASR